jgi:hypothetical protein
MSKVGMWPGPRGWRILCSLMSVLVALCTFAAPSEGASTMQWTPYAEIDSTPGLGGFPNAVTDISCPSLALCVAVSIDGDIDTSTTPAETNSWKISKVDPGGGISISCPTTSACVGADGMGNLLGSSDPTGGAPAWSISNPVAAPYTNIYDAIACASATVCVAGADGALATTTSSGGWQDVEFPGINTITGVSCPSTSLCVATYDAGTITPTGAVPTGGVLTSTNPTGGAAAWTATTLYRSFNGVSCPTTTLCVAAVNDPNAGVVLTSTDPTGGAGAWSSTNTGSDLTLQAVSCASTTLCVAGTAGDTVFSSNPAGGTGAWNVDDAGKGGVVQGVSCPLSTSTCFSVGGTGLSVGTVVPAHALNVTVNGSGAGRVLGADLSCPGMCSDLVPQGTSATLMATAFPGSFLAGWSRPCARAATKDCKLKMSREEAVTATFDGDQPRCSITPRTSTILLARPRHRRRASIDTLTVSVRCDQKTRVNLNATITAATLRKSAGTITLKPRHVSLNAGLAKTIKLKLPGKAIADLERRRHEAIRLDIRARGAHGSSTASTTLPTLHAKRG